MPDPNERNSLVKDIHTRYDTQHVGGTFDIKDTLGPSHVGIPSGKVIDAASAKGEAFQSPNGFTTKVPNLESQFKVVQSGGTQGVSVNAPGPQATIAGQVVDAASANAQQFQSPNGFEVKVPIMESRMIMVKSGGKSGISKYVRGLDTRRYSNFQPSTHS